MRRWPILVLMLSSACSFFMVRHASPDHPMDCRAPVAAPVLDIGGFLLSGGMVALGGLAAADEHPDSKTAAPLIIAGGLASIAFLVSSVYGFVNVGSCPTMVPTGED
jgi:hypothetical protein